MSGEQSKPSSAETDPVGHAQKIAARVASDHPEESANAMHKLGLLMAKNNVSKKLADLLTGEAPHLLNGGGKTRAELETEIADKDRKIEEYADANAAYVAQNEAIRNAYERTCRPGLWKRLKDVFTPAASADGSTFRKGFLRNAFAAAVPGVLAAGTLMMGVPWGIHFLITSIATIAASGFCLYAFPNPEHDDVFSIGGLFAGMLTGAALSLALVFAAASGAAPDKQAVSTAPEESVSIAAAATRPEAATPVGAVMKDGTVYAGVPPKTGKPLYTTPKDPGMLATWPEANAYCKNLTVHGHDDWRLPEEREDTRHGFLGNTIKGEDELYQLFANRAAIGGFDSDNNDPVPNRPYQTRPDFSNYWSATSASKVSVNGEYEVGTKVTIDFISRDKGLDFFMDSQIREVSFRCVRG